MKPNAYTNKITLTFDRDTQKVFDKDTRYKIYSYKILPHFGQVYVMTQIMTELHETK